MAIFTHRDVAHTMSRSSVKLKPLYDSFAVRVPLSTTCTSQEQLPDEADDQQTAQSGCISLYTLMAIEQQQIIAIAVCAAWAASPQSGAIAIPRLPLCGEELPGESYFACLGDEAMMFLESETVAGFFELDDDN